MVNSTQYQCEREDVLTNGEPGGMTQTMKIVEQYRLQLLQYENLLSNPVGPAACVWNRRNSRLMNAMNTF